ncbi:MAG: hypothetical protein K9H64_13600 [Bacteroidales bacterium]|nr:hypothetical protein [Bacteroidales bacterium]MCF8457048.1 hypothetical protein [Bacteroidales bacterium]
MKEIKNSLPTFFALLAISLLSFQAMGQEPVKSRNSLEYYKISEHRVLKATLKAKEGRNYIFLQDFPVEFNIVIDTGSVSLGSSNTNESGEAIFEVPDEMFRLHSTNGVTSFEAIFAGTERYKPSESSLEVKDLKMNLSFTQEEEEKQILLTATELNGDESVPISEELEINFYVPRTFTLFPIGSKSLESGKVIIPFPVDLPGDTLGNMEVIAKIEGNDTYGNVSVSSAINWGLAQAKIVETNRGLGDTNAPLWMVYTLIVLLSVVWFHYMYILYSIYLIKKESKKALAENM